MSFGRSWIVIAVLSGMLSGGPAEGGSLEWLIVEHGPRDSGKIALTFDACPTGMADEYDQKVIEILRREQVPATLFLSGKWVRRNPDKAKLLADHPLFELANHSYHHPHMTKITDARLVTELLTTQEDIVKLTGRQPRFFRPPYGEVDERVARHAAAAGLVTVQYDLASGDPDPNLSAKAIIRRVLQKARGGSIIVFHMNKRGWRTAEVLPEIIAGLRKKGYALVTVEEMLAARGAAARTRDASLPPGQEPSATDVPAAGGAAQPVRPVISSGSAAGG